MNSGGSGEASALRNRECEPPSSGQLQRGRLCTTEEGLPAGDREAGARETKPQALKQSKYRPPNRTAPARKVLAQAVAVTLKQSVSCLCL